MRDLPPLKAIRVFEACMRLGSFTRAARDLNVGQPAVSHQIQALEADLGVPLFERRGGRSFPTSQALAYHRVLSDALADIARASRSLRQRAGRPGLTLATYPGIAMFWLMPRLEALRRSDGRFAVSVVTGERDADMPLTEVDCAILFGDGRWPGYESRLLMPEAVVPVAAPALAAEHLGRPFEAMLENGPLIHLEDREGRWFNWREWQRQRAPEAVRIDPGVEVTNHGIALHQALMGKGIALGWRGVIDDMVENGLLTALDGDAITSPRGYHLVGPSAFFASATGKAVLDALAAT